MQARVLRIYTPGSSDEHLGLRVISSDSPCLTLWEGEQLSVH